MIDPVNIDAEIERSAAFLFHHGQIVAFKEKEVALKKLQLKVNKEQAFLELKNSISTKGKPMTEKEIEATYRTDEDIIKLEEEVIEEQYGLSLAQKKYDTLNCKDSNIRAIYARRKGE
jgi:Mg2+ and Co2+ transporter CorA